MRNIIFISHANPNDNDFTKWLALKLIGLGYEVWCDILFLDKGADFWKVIDKNIREFTIKFLLVTTEIAIKRDGVLKEITVAEKVKKQLQDENFIIPLMVDTNLSYDDLPPEVIRINAIDFKNSWASGLKDLLEALEKQKVPKVNLDFTRSSQLYQQIFLYDKSVIEKEEIYDSNWFSIISFPKELKFYEIPLDFDEKTLNFSAITYKNYLCTFAGENDINQILPDTQINQTSKTIKIQINDILTENYNSDFIGFFECKRLIVQLLNKAFNKRMKNKILRDYQMSNKIAYWIEKGNLEKDKYNKVQLIGKQKEKNWHFGISAAAKLYPYPVFMISSHIIFTDNGIELIDSRSIQHSSRRRKGKNWWNNDWRSKLLAFIQYISDDNTSFFLEFGSEERVLVSNTPIQFKCDVSYNIPVNNTLEEENEFADFYDYDNFDLD